MAPVSVPQENGFMKGALLSANAMRALRTFPERIAWPKSTGPKSNSTLSASVVTLASANWKEDIALRAGKSCVQDAQTSKLIKLVLSYCILFN